MYRNYEAALQQHEMVDFDGLIFKTVTLFESSPEILRKYQARFRWLAVDEYQDLNFAQYRLLRLLKTPEANLCVIGDPDQAIYGFRGADRSYFLQFQADFPDAKMLRLSQNYRSTQMILDASRQVIAQSAANAPDEIWSEFVSQTKLEVYHAPTEKAEAEYVVHEIEKMVGGVSYFSLDSGRVASHEDGTRGFGDFAVLYRLKAQGQPLAEAFERSGIPYRVVGDKPLAEYKDIQELLAYLWLLVKPESSFHRGLVKRPAGTLAPFLDDLRSARDAESVAQSIERIAAQTQAGAPEQADAKRAERLKRLLLRAIPYGNRFTDFLEAIVLQKETDEYDSRADRVTLMTLHAAKGLEFPVVFITGCEETVMPYQREGKIEDVEEERRLFYVGMTRAQAKLILTHAQARFLFGQTARNAPSRFWTILTMPSKPSKTGLLANPGKSRPLKHN